jgi:hypothetical protein
MKPRFKALLTALAVVVLAAAVMVPIASASGSSGSPSGMLGGVTGDDGWCGGGTWNGSGQWGGTGMWSMGSGMQWLRDNPVAMQVWLKLRSDHQAAMQDWYDTYKADLTTSTAQQALHDLWQTFWDDMRSFYEQYANGATWTCPSNGMWNGWDMGGMMGDHHWDARHMWGTGYGAEWMMGHATGMGQWLQLRGRQTADVMTWMQKHQGALRSAGARTDLNHMMASHRAAVKSFFQHHGLRTNATMMQQATGGWMGLGGMWGGWGW